MGKNGNGVSLMILKPNKNNAAKIPMIYTGNWHNIATYKADKLT